MTAHPLTTAQYRATPLTPNASAHLNVTSGDRLSEIAP